METASGNKESESIAALAQTIREKMESGQRVVLGDLWENLQRKPFGYYDTIACGILLGYVFSCYKDSAYSWTDNALGSHVLDEANLKTMVRSNPGLLLLHGSKVIGKWSHNDIPADMIKEGGKITKTSAFLPRTDVVAVKAGYIIMWYVLPLLFRSIPAKILTEQRLLK